MSNLTYQGKDADGAEVFCAVGSPEHKRLLRRNVQEAVVKEVEGGGEDYDLQGSREAVVEEEVAE